MTKKRTVGSLGERALIKRLTRNNEVGTFDDDVAIVKHGNEYLLYTTDTLIEDNHFSRKWMTPEQVGKKAIEVNVSDIYASGGTPKHILVALSLPPKTPLSWVDGLYKGMRAACRRHGCAIIGGDTTKADKIIITITATGEARREELCPRSAAKPGDLLFVTGPLGRSAAGLDALKRGLKGHDAVKKAHKEPWAQGRLIKPIRTYINAMIDISDGLSSEVHHLCAASKMGCLLFLDNVPLDDDTRTVAAKLRKDPLEYALSGGEDFQLLYTLPERHLSKAKGFLLGEITKDKKVKAIRNGREKFLKDRGFDQLR